MQTLPVLDAWFSKCQRNKNERPGLQNVYFKCTWNHPNKLIAHLHHQVWWPPLWVFPDSSAGKESACNAGNLSSIPGLGRSPGEGKGCPFQYSGLENPMDCIVHGVTKSWTRLSDFHSLTGFYFIDTSSSLPHLGSLISLRVSEKLSLARNTLLQEHFIPSSDAYQVFFFIKLIVLLIVVKTEVSMGGGLRKSRVIWKSISTAATLKQFSSE